MDAIKADQHTFGEPRMVAEPHLLVDATTALAIMNRNQVIGGQAKHHYDLLRVAPSVHRRRGPVISAITPADPDLALAGVDDATYFVSAGTQPVPSTVTATNLTVPQSFHDRLPSAAVEVTCAATTEIVESGYTSAQLQVLKDSLDAGGSIDLTTARAIYSYGLCQQFWAHVPNRRWRR